jgi:hypothetical protein
MLFPIARPLEPRQQGLHRGAGSHFAQLLAAHPVGQGEQPFASAGTRGYLGERVPEIILVVVAYNSAVGRLGKFEFQHIYATGVRCGTMVVRPLALLERTK